ncbi:MAG: hypothetical protein ETSY1_02140 [Candidatus Entotheonella factor]|uniref:Carboxymuconolactone decarboxylase-like domain-containing protein n=1 Tax=Entotheonella factor TaxID=1429438 RepID=W4LYN0_ENTF1|nr:MAG: hypothetical protein ETSY1_02140 [Candidatus Entotheonella factor]
MSRFALIKDTSDSPKLEDLYQDIINNGFGSEVPINWFTAQGGRPDLLEGTWGLVKSILIEGTLPATVKQMIAMTISMQNNCRYCSVTHTHALEAMGVPKTVIDTCATDPDLSQIPQLHRAILQFALKAAREPNAISDEDIRALKAHDLKDGEIMEVAMMAAFMNFINTWADVSGITVDGEE